MEEVPEEVDPPLGPRPQDLGTLGAALEHGDPLALPQAHFPNALSILLPLSNVAASSGAQNLKYSAFSHTTTTVAKE